MIDKMTETICVNILKKNMAIGLHLYLGQFYQVLIDCQCIFLFT